MSLSCPVTPNTETAIETQLAGKERLLSQLREQAEALEQQIHNDQERLTTARSGRRPRTALLGADTFSPRLQTGRSQMSAASTARTMTAVSQILAPMIEGNVEKLSFDRPMTGMSTMSRPITSRADRSSMVAMHPGECARGVACARLLDILIAPLIASCRSTLRVGVFADNTIFRCFIF